MAALPLTFLIIATEVEAYAGETTATVDTRRKIMALEMPTIFRQTRFIFDTLKDSYIPKHF
jgi:hypothetical protein